MSKKYFVVNRTTLKIPNIKFATREEARAYKRSKGFRYGIVKADTLEMVR